MDTPVRLRLYQYAYSPYCIPIELILRHSGIPYDMVNLNVGDPRPVIHLTEGQYYMVPVIQDMFNNQIVYDKSPAGDDVARFIMEQAPLMNLFPEAVSGVQKVLVSYIENQCEEFSFKVCDAHRDRWLHTDVERGLHRRHKERKFGVGCLEEWTRNVDQLTEGFYNVIQPFEQMLSMHPFLTGDRPVYADYVLCGVIGNFLFPGNTTLPANNLMIESWYTRMRAGNFGSSFDGVHLSHDSSGDAAGHAGAPADISDLEKALSDIKIRPGTNGLDVSTGNGHGAVYLAEKGYNMTACDLSGAMLKQAEQYAAEKKVKIAFHEHAAEKLPYADNSFGLLTCRAAAHHFSSPEAFVRESVRVLKTYGYLVVIDNTVPDDQIDANEWMNAVEKLRDPSHIKFITPNVWRHWCVSAGLTVTRAQVETLKQPDLNTYFNSVNTPPENRKKILEMLAKAPASARELFKIGQEDGKIIWYARRLTLVAGKL